MHIDCIETEIHGVEMAFESAEMKVQRTETAVWRV